MSAYILTLPVLFPYISDKRKWNLIVDRLITLAVRLFFIIVFLNYSRGHCLLIGSYANNRESNLIGLSLKYAAHFAIWIMATDRINSG